MTAPEEEFPTLLTVAEVAGLLRVSRMTVYRMIRAEVLPMVRVRQRSFRVPEPAVRTYISSGGGS